MILSQTKAGKSKICFGTGVLTCLDLKQMRQSEGVWWSGRCQDPTAVQPHMGKCFEGQGKNRHHSPRAYQSIPILWLQPYSDLWKSLALYNPVYCWSLPRFHTFSIIWELATRFSTVYTHPKLTQTTVLFYKNDSVNGGVIWLGLGNAIDLLIFTTPSSILELFFPFFLSAKKIRLAGINKVRFDGNDEIIEAMLSVEGEVVELVSQATGWWEKCEQLDGKFPTLFCQRVPGWKGTLHPRWMWMRATKKATWNAGF